MIEEVANDKSNSSSDSDDVAIAMIAGRDQVQMFKSESFVQNSNSLDYSGLAKLDSLNFLDSFSPHLESNSSTCRPNDLALVPHVEDIGLPKNGLPFITFRKKSGLRKMKRIGPPGRLKLDYSNSIADSAIIKINRILVEALASSMLTVEAIKSWEMGLLLSLF